MGRNVSKLSLLRMSSIAAAVVCVLALPASAFAAAQRTLTGTVTAVSSDSVTVQTPGREAGVIDAMIATANRLTKGDYPYVWGGGHAQAGVPSIGGRGPGYNGRREGFDCSGSVTAVLAGAGLWPAGSGVPGDAGVIAQLMQDRLIAPGPGAPPDEVMLYDDPGVHIFMSINGRFFGTSDGGGGNSKGGPTWLDDGAWDASSKAFKHYHVLPSVLHEQVNTGLSYTFELSPNTVSAGTFVLGDRVTVGYRQAGSGMLMARAIGYAGAVMTHGVVAAISADGSSVSVATANGTRTFSTAADPSLLSGLEAGDKVRLIYTKTQGKLVARVLSMTASPTVSEISGTITRIAANLSSFRLETSSGQTMKFSTGGDTSLMANLASGAAVQVSYVQVNAHNLVARSLAAAAPTAPGGPTTGGPPATSN
jgi:Cu/Ag efflux protein CusF